MKEFNSEEYGKMCAEFLGYEISENKECFKTPNKNGWVNLNIFYTDWNCIMEVLEKIEDSLGGLVALESKTCFMCVTIKYRNYNNTTVGPYSKKEAAVQAIWHFLNWYKENEQYIKENKS
jgi:hypothetical protein